jgi:polyferredoxin
VLADNRYDTYFVRGKRRKGELNLKQEDRVATGKEMSTVSNVLMFVPPVLIFEMVQLECVNCTACIDECDTIMESVGLPKGLIRYARTKSRKHTF